MLIIWWEKKTVNLISKINLPLQKDIRNFKKLTKCGIGLVKKKFSFALLNYFGELQPNWNVIFHIFAEKIFVCQALKANALSTLNAFTDRIFIQIPGMQFQLIPRDAFEQVLY